MSNGLDDNLVVLYNFHSSKTKINGLPNNKTHSRKIKLDDIPNIKNGLTKKLDSSWLLTIYTYLRPLVRSA